MKEWWGELGIIQVGFDNGGCVLWTRFVEVSTGPQTFIDRVKAWLNWVVLLRMPSSKNGSGVIAEPAMLSASAARKDIRRPVIVSQAFGVG
jgi:hypothetical protein